MVAVEGVGTMELHANRNLKKASKKEAVMLVKQIKSIWNMLPTIIGIIQAVLPLLKELVVTVVRIIAILPLLWDKADPIIEEVNKVYDKVYQAVEKFKNLLLFLGVEDNE